MVIEEICGNLRKKNSINRGENVDVLVGKNNPRYSRRYAVILVRKNCINRGDNVVVRVGKIRKKQHKVIEEICGNPRWKKQHNLIEETCGNLVGKNSATKSGRNGLIPVEKLAQGNRGDMR